MKCTPQYLFEKYGKEVLAHWDYSYDEETDEDVEYSDGELKEVVRELIELGADLNYVEEDGDTPIHHFVYYFDILKMLVEEYGMDVKVLDKGNFVYDLLILDDRIDILKYLLDHGIDINRRDCNGWSILHHAVNRRIFANCINEEMIEKCRNLGMIKMLLEHGADPNAQSKMGTPLHRWLDNADIARLLLEHGADPNSRDWDNWTPLCLCRDVETARVLMKFGADPNLDLGELRTPLLINPGYICDAMKEMGHYRHKRKQSLNMYSRAFDIAQKCHQNQVDKVGVSIFNHVRDVAFRCATDEQKTVAILHDSIEDGGMTADELRAAGFDETIVEAVLAVTRNKGEDYFDYIRRCAQNPIARKVKMHDIEHNLEIIRFARNCKPVADIRTKEFRKHGPFVLNEKDLYRLNKYLMAYEMLRTIDDKEAFDNPGLKTCLASCDSTLDAE